MLGNTVTQITVCDVAEEEYERIINSEPFVEPEDGFLCTLVGINEADNVRAHVFYAPCEMAVFVCYPMTGEEAAIDEARNNMLTFCDKMSALGKSVEITNCLPQAPFFDTDVCKKLWL